MRTELELSHCHPFVSRFVHQSTILLLGLFLIGLTACEKKEEKPVAQAPDVQLGDVLQQDVPLYSDWVGVLDGFVNAQIQPQVTGYLLKQNYREGTVVKKGEVMFEIDPRPFEAALDQAKGNLAEAVARLGKTELDVKRDTPLAAQSAIPQAQLDNDIQSNEAAKAMVVAAQAMVDQAQLNLGFTKVRSLVDGIAGIAQGQIGDLVGPSKVLTTVSQVNPIKVYVSLSEQEYLGFASKVARVAEQGARPGDGKRTLQLILANGETYPTKGWVELADRQVDLRTGTIRFAGAFDNPSGLLRPGQFSRVKAETSIAKGALLVPQKAVVETQGQYSVVVVGSDNKADIRPVKMGPRIGELWIVSEGLKPGERVITEGVQKVRQGSPVRVVQSVAENSSQAKGE